MDYKKKYLKNKLKYINAKKKIKGGTNAFGWLERRVANPSPSLEEPLSSVLPSLSQVLDVTLYAENHFEASTNWKEFVFKEMDKYDVIIIEEDWQLKLIDHDFIPKVNIDTTWETLPSGSAIVDLRQSKTVVKSDVRFLLGIPIDEHLSTILVSVYMAYRENIISTIMNFLRVNFIRNLLNPSIPYLNILTSLKSKLTDNEYTYIKKKYHEIITIIKRDTDSVINTLENLSPEMDNEDLYTIFNKQIEIIMFKLPQLLNDIYVTGLIMSYKNKKVMVIYGKCTN